MVSNHNYLINVRFITELNSLPVVNDKNFLEVYGSYTCKKSVELFIVDLVSDSVLIYCLGGYF